MIEKSKIKNQRSKTQIKNQRSKIKDQRSKSKLRVYLASKRRLIDQALNGYLPKGGERPRRIHSAMRYAVFSGGKRIRPILAIASCEAAGGDYRKAIPYASAIELIHSYSLVHDDLPALDNDDFRRGKPSCHKKFGESTAILVGDALLTLAFNLMTKGKDERINLRVVREISDAIGTGGMIGGQVEDLAAKNKNVKLAMRNYIDTHKTGALIAVSCKVGAIAAGAPEAKIERLFKFGKFLGHCFQVVDDILDGESAATDLAEELAEAAKRELKPFGRKAEILREISDFVLNRGR